MKGRQILILLTLIIIFINLSLISCKPVYRIILGAKPSKIETIESSLSWLKKNLNMPISEDQVLSLSPEGFPLAFDINPIIIDSKNTRILYNGCTDNKCFKDLSSLFEFYDSKDSLLNTLTTVNNQLSFNRNATKVFPYIRSLKGHTIDNLPENSLILPYAIFLGNKKQKKDLLQFINAAQKNKNIRWNIVFLCIDKQAWWGDEWNRKIEMGLN
jgi:hypothetical protein